MQQTLLNAVNEVLKRTGTIAGDAGELLTLNDLSRQRAIDVAVQVINEGVDELYSVSGIALPKEQAESVVTLVAGQRSYDLAVDLVQLRWPLIDRSNTQFIREFPGGYNAILVFDPEQDDEGLPHYAAISPVNGELFLDRAPQAHHAGRVYTYQYDKDLALSTPSATFPFGDAVFRAMVPAWVQLWTRDMRQEFDGSLFRASLGRAARLMTKQQPRSSYSPR